MTNLISNINRKLAIVFVISLTGGATIAVIILFVISSANQVRPIDLGPVTIASINYDANTKVPIITSSFELPYTGADAIKVGLQDPILCSFGRGKFYLSDEFYRDSEYLIIYNYLDQLTGLYLYTENIMPKPWLKLDELRGGGGIPVVDKEHYGLFVLFRNPNESCRGSGKSGPQSPTFLRGSRTEYETPATPTPTLGISETFSLALESLSSDSRTFLIANDGDGTTIETGITSSHLHAFMSGLTNIQEGSSKWIDNVSHRGITGDMDSSYLSNILEGAETVNLTVNLWINIDKQINAATIEGTVKYKGAEFSKLNITLE